MKIMKQTREKTKDLGVYTQEVIHKHLGRTDVDFHIYYKDKIVKKVWKTVGYKSEGMTPTLIYTKRSEIIVSQNEPEPIPNITFKEAWEYTWENNFKSNKSTASYKHRYRNNLSFLNYKFLPDISKKDIEFIVKEKISVGLSPQTVRHFSLGGVPVDGG